MRWLSLYLRSRGVPPIAGAGLGLVALAWTPWTMFSKTRDVDFPYVLLIVVLLVSAVSVTLAGPDDALDRTAAKPWRPRRLAHLLVTYALITAVLLATLATPARFGPAAEVSRDVAGLLGLTALGAALLGAHRSWFLPLLWTLPALYISAIAGEGGAAEGPPSWTRQALTWMMQPIDSRPAAIVAAALAIAGLLAFSLRGTPPRPASDPAPA
ncbi:hypothetical protein AB0M36_10320 [Actinoplanes sp. NPDC051346]|uniref:hypothetical protein n=1 Tax=Actinoplanes sp. NPDC051346 TaxID=3155048 RepID=UPI0034137726